MAKNDSIDITKEDFKKLHQKMKSLDNGWAETLEQMVNKEIESDPVKYAGMEPCQRIKIYNVLNGIVRNTKWKMLIYAQGLEFIKDRENQLSELKSQAKQIV